jgi:hypothetical protein
MKTFFLSKIGRSSFVLFLLLTASPLAQAQFVVYDPAQFGNMIHSIAQQAQQLSTALKTLTEAKTLVQQAIVTKQEILGLHKLERDVQAALKIARGIVDLKWADLDGLTHQVLQVPIDPDVYMPILPQTNRLRHLLRNAPSTASTKDLYEMLLGVTSYSGRVSDFADFAQRNNQALVQNFALSEMGDQKKIQTAMSYNQLAEEFIVQATELKQAVKTDTRLTMNESERIQALKACQDLLMQSFDLKLKADELLRSIPEENNRAVQAARQAYENALYRDALAQTPQQKYGQ